MNSYLYIKVEGKKINRFLLKCNNNNIDILSIKYISNKSVIILINEKDYKKILKLKGINKFKIINKKGFKKIKSLINKYKYLIISFCVGLIILLILSNIIFSVEVIGDNNNMNDLIKKELSNYGIEKYKFKKDYKKIDKIKRKLKSKYKDNIEWIEIKESGVKYIVNFVERKIEKKEKDNKIYSIVAKRNGVIKDIYTYDGISLVEVGDYVSKGDILISSDIILNEEVKKQVNTNGKIYAEVWYKSNIEYPLNYKEKKLTNNKRKIFYIKISKKYYELFKYKKFDRKKIISYKDKFSLFEVGIEEIREIKYINKKYTNKKALQKAKESVSKKIKDKLNKDEYIISKKTLNFYNNGSKIIVDIFFSVYEEIGEKKKIEMGEVNDTKNTGDGI